MGTPLAGRRGGLGGGLCGKGGEERCLDGIGSGGWVGAVAVGVLSGVVEARVINCWIGVIGVLCCGWVWGLLMCHLAVGWHIAGSTVAAIGSIGVHE
jgi:hypothetical protein